MRTVKEIGLFKPTLVSEAGYRLYDDKALEILQQILFFREFDMPLKEIKAVLKNPDLDKNELLKSQQKNKMNFAVFNKADIEQLYRDMLKNMTDEQKDIFIKEYGSIKREAGCGDGKTGSQNGSGSIISDERCVCIHVIF